jgi:hypothetical protein
MAKEVVSKEAPCPNCKHRMDRASAVNEDGTASVPKPDDISVCISCGNWNAYDTDMQLRELSEDEIAALPQEIFTQLTLMSRAVAAAHRAVKEREKRRK